LEDYSRKKNTTAKMNGKGKRNAISPCIQKYANICNSFVTVTGNSKSNSAGGLNIRK
jgi:hypothetical protein